MKSCQKCFRFNVDEAENCSAGGAKLAVWKEPATMLPGVEDNPGFNNPDADPAKSFPEQSSGMQILVRILGVCGIGIHIAFLVVCVAASGLSDSPPAMTQIGVRCFYPLFIMDIVLHPAGAP